MKVDRNSKAKLFADCARPRYILYLGVGQRETLYIAISLLLHNDGLRAIWSSFFATTLLISSACIELLMCVDKEDKLSTIHKRADGCYSNSEQAAKRQ